MFLHAVVVYGCLSTCDSTIAHYIPLVRLRKGAVKGEVQWKHWMWEEV